MRVRDPEIVAAVVAGDPAGLAAAYETYAPALYTYCRSLLRDPDEAADALHDTFVVASQKLDGLRDPERLRPWLYAVARNECLRLLRARNRTVALEDTDDVSDDSVDLTLGVRQEQLRDLVRAALDGLNAGDREVLDLSMRHELNGPELGAALGVSAKHAHALLSRARGQMEIALGALLVARAGSRDCEQLAELLGDWDGHFTTLIRKRVNRHIEDCDVCRDRRRGELAPAMLLGLGPILLPPPELRAKILRLCGDVAPEAVAQRATTAKRAEPFDLLTGFPVQLDRRRRAALRRRATVSTALALLLLLICATGASAALQLGPFRRAADHKADVHIVVAGPTTTDLVISVSGIPTTPGPSLSSVTASKSLSPSPTTSSATATATGSAYLVVTPASTPAPPAAPTQPRTSATTPTPSLSPTPSLPPSPPRPSPSVSVTGTPVRMDGYHVTGYFELTAEGGTVDYTVSLPADPATYGDPTVSSPSGTLTVGENVVEAIKITDWSIATKTSFDLTVSPGDIQISVTW